MMPFYRAESGSREVRKLMADSIPCRKQMQPLSRPDTVSQVTTVHLITQKVPVYLSLDIAIVGPQLGNRGLKLINKLVINKVGKFEFFHVGKNNSHPRKNEKMDNFVKKILHYSCVFLDF